MKMIDDNDWITTHYHHAGKDDDEYDNDCDKT
jgi:hypothetical protein